MKALRLLLLTFLLAATTLMFSGTTVFGGQAVVDNIKYSHQPRFDDCILIDGVDVSEWQWEVNWSRVKRSGMDYAFIRLGWTGLDSPFSRHKDVWFESNYKNAKDAGLLVGVYYYSCATTEAEAKKEAQYVLSILDDRDLDLPVIFDFEYTGRIQTKYVNRAQTTKNILAFLNYIDANSDYDTMFYSYRSIMDPSWSPKFNMSSIEGKHRVWIAQYYEDIETYTRPFEFWQYTSSGKVWGVDGSVDCNFWYFDEANYKAESGKKSIQKADITLGTKSYKYSSYAKKPSVTVKYNGTTLKEGTHYKKFYVKNVLAGTAYVMIQGVGSYSGITVEPFTIKKIDFESNCEINGITNKTYKGSAITQNISVVYNGRTLKKGTDYSVSYKNNVNAGTATVTITGKRNFTGAVSKTFKIYKKDLSKMTPKLSYSVGGYTGKARCPVVTISGLKKDVDYTVKYSNNTSIGKATVTITGIGNCSGIIKKNFTIQLAKPKNVTTRLAKDKFKGYNDVYVTWDKVYGATSYRLYYKPSTSKTWKYKTINGGSNTSKCLYNLTSGTKYNFKVVARCSKGSSYDSAIVSRTTLKKVVQNNVKTYSTKNSKVSVTWKNIGGETGYQISQSINKKKINIVATLKSTSATKKTIKATKGKTYYYRVRAYRTVQGVNVYGPWSTVKAYKLK